MRAEDMQIIDDAVASYRVGAPIIIEDIRIAARADGHDLSHVSGYEIAAYLRTICKPVHKAHLRIDWVRVV